LGIGEQMVSKHSELVDMTCFQHGETETLIFIERAKNVEMVDQSGEIYCQILLFNYHTHFNWVKLTLLYSLVHKAGNYKTGIDGPVFRRKK